jgi:uncharacterized protein involved in exopolysaccharide biosynthesis
MTTEELELRRVDKRPMPTLRDIFAVLFRQRWPMLAAIAIVIIVVAISGAWIPKYEAHMKFLVRRPRADATLTPWANAPAQLDGDQVSEEDLNSEVDLLTSEDLLRNVVLATGLNEGHGLATDRASEVKIATEVRYLSKDLKVEAVRKSNILSASYQSRDPEIAAKVLKALAAAYMEKHSEVYRSSGEFKFFDQQTEQYRQSLDQAQQRLTEFTKDSGIVSAQSERDSSLQRANEFDSTAHQAQAAVVETQQRIRTLQAQLQAVQPRMTTVVRTSENPELMQQLKSTLLTLKLKRTELLTKYEPSHRLVEENDEQIAEALSAISAEDDKPIREETTDQDPNYQWIKAELTKAQADLGGLVARATASSSMAEQYREAARRFDQREVVQQDLVRTAKTQEENYLLYMRKREEARISAALDEHGILNVTISEQPIIPALPVRSPLIVGMLTLLAAVAVCLSTAFVVDSMDPTFRTPDELARYLGAPGLAALPKGGERAFLLPVEIYKKM